MDMKIFLKKIYTVAFRLTGEEKIAEKIAVSAITQTNKKLNEDFEATENTFRLTIIEVVKIFLNMQIPYYKNNFKGIQNALLKLNPTNRAVIIWKDVLGFKLSDNMPIENYSCEELSKTLNLGRKELKDYF